MTKLTPFDFMNHADWSAYVRQCVPENEQAYTLANGRTELFRRLYRARKQNLPVEFERERHLIETLTEPARPAALDELNKRILTDLTRRLFDLAGVEAPEDDAAPAPTARQLLDELVQHLVQKNPYFARWKERQVSREAQLATATDSDSTELKDAEFASAMSDLGKLLALYWVRDQALPALTFERIWFLHNLREPERMLQTRAVLNMLTAELGPCTSA